MAKEPVLHPITKEIRGTRPPSEKLRMLRSLMHNILKLVMNRGAAGIEETQSILYDELVHHSLATATSSWLVKILNRWPNY